MTVVILGLARQGTALARFFAAEGARVIVSDSRSATALQPAIDSLSAWSVEYALGGHPLSLLDDCDLLCLSGGIPLDIQIVREAMRRQIPVSNDAQEFLRRSPAPVLGITGSAGKTTTTTLVGRMVETAGFRTWVGGNIGNPLIDEVSDIEPSDRVVMELSSFQLELMDISPHVAGVLNITPNHLDRHKTMAAYIAAKRRIVAYQTSDDVAVLGYDDLNARSLHTATPADVRYFSGRREVPVGAFLRGEELVLRRNGEDTVVCTQADVRLRGFHNLVNVLAAITLADAVGADPDAMREVIRTFTGVPHRLEEVRRLHGVVWINDSIATAPERVLAALDAFDEPLILLAGGRDKDLPWEAFAQRVVARVRLLILFGEAASLIQGHVKIALAAFEGETSALDDIVMAESLEQAVQIAAARARPGEVVLLSPGGTSFDAFKDFAERGECFRGWVDQLA